MTMLVMYISEAYESYIVKRLLDVAIGHRAPRSQIHKKIGSVDPSGVEEIAELLYTVPSGNDPDVRSAGVKIS